MNRLLKIAKVKPGEGTRTLILFLQYFFVVAVAIAGKSARDTYFLSRYDRSLLPLMFAACAVAVAIAAGLYGRVSRRLSAKALFDMTNFIFLAGLVLLWVRLRGYAIPALYVWVEITVAIISLSFWLAASEAFDPRQAKRLFGLIGGGGAVAAILVGAGIKPFVEAFGAESLLFIVLAALAGQWALGRYSDRFAHTHPVAVSAPRQQAADRRFDSYLVSIAAVISLSAFASQVVDFQFKVFAAEAIPNEADLASFFGHFHAFTGGATLLVQFFLTSTILTRYGLLPGLLTLPVFLSVGSLAVLFRPILASATIGKFADQTLKFTLNNSSMELLWLPVPVRTRRAVRPVISGTVKYVAESSAGLCTFFLVQYTGLQYLSLVSVAALGAWILTASRLKPLYVRALVSALEKRQVEIDDLALDAQDPAFIGIIEKALNSGDEAQQLSALELIEGLPLAPWEQPLKSVFEDGSAAVKQRVLKTAISESKVLSDIHVVESLRAERPVALEAIRVAVSRRLDEAQPILAELIDCSDPAIRAAAAAALLENRDAEQAGKAAAVLEALLHSPDSTTRAAALPHLRDRPDLLTPATISALLDDPSIEVREKALQVVAARQDASLIEGVVECLDDPRTAPFAEDALRSFPVAEVVPHLERVLSEVEAAAARKIGTLRALAKFPTNSSVPLLLKAITPEDLNSSGHAVYALLRLARNQEIPAALLADLPSRAVSLVRSAYRSNRLLKLLGNESADTLMCRNLRDRIRQVIPTVLAMEMLGSRERPLAEVVAIAGDSDPAKQPLLLELLDNVLSPDKRVQISPLIEALSLEERDAIGARLYSDLPERAEPELEKAVYSHSEWESAITIDHLWRTGSGRLLLTVDWSEVPDFQLTREMRAIVENQPTHMYSTLEKTILLKSVSLFADLPVEKLAKIALVCEESRMAVGAVVMREGELGASLFIVAHGVVRVHKAGQTLAFLKRGDCVGEMALLDHSPRSADVTVEEDAALLRIGREDFDEVTIANPEIMQGIVRLLVRRLREANEKLTRESAAAS